MATRALTVSAGDSIRTYLFHGCFTFFPCSLFFSCPLPAYNFCAQCWGQHLCMSSTFSMGILNETCSLCFKKNCNKFWKWSTIKLNFKLSYYSFIYVPIFFKVNINFMCHPSKLLWLIQVNMVFNLWQHHHLLCLLISAYLITVMFFVIAIIPKLGTTCTLLLA